ncbi:MAG: hypothetical protein DRH08_00660 [Deltaproteobacteria bacterium]|nr:MAG: hypothetical protein DRH08_00660 [Deltaproteobacteria bacterium]
MDELAIIRLEPMHMASAITELTNERLNTLIELTDDAAIANRLARIERGRRTEKMSTAHVLPGSTGLSQTERNKRSEERIVAEWYDDTEEADVEQGWKKMVGHARAKRRESQIADTTATAVTLAGDTTKGDISVLHGDFRDRLYDLPDGSVDLIITDPPYPEEFMPLWTDLAEQAARLLGPRGILFAWSGKIFLPEVMNRLGSYLTYGWVFKLDLPGANSRIMGRHLRQTWKPVLAYTTGTWPSNEWGDDALLSPQKSKDDYEWEQHPDPATELIRRYSPEGGLIVDPFLGVGTFGEAARDLGRRFIGVELDAGRAVTATERIFG